MDEPFLRYSTCDGGSRQVLTQLIPATEPSESRRKGFFDGFSFRDLLGAVMGPLLLLPFAIAFVGMVVAASPGLKADFPLILLTVIFSQTLSTFIFVAFSQFTTCTNIDLLSAAFLAKLCTVLQPFVTEHDMFIHLCLGQGMFTLAVGILLCIAVWLDGNWYLRFLPYTVSTGFVTGIGLLILNGGFEMGCGHSIQELATGVGVLPTVVFMHAALAVLAACVFRVVSHGIRSALRLPIGIVVNTLLFHGVARLAGFTMESLTSWEFLMDGLQPVPWTAGWVELSERFGDFSPSVFLRMPVMTLAASYAALHAIYFSFYAAVMPEIDESSHGKKISMKKEIAVMGGTHIVVGCLAGVPASHSPKVMVVMQAVGAKSKVWSLLVGIAFSLVYFCAGFRTQLVIVPKCTFGGLVIFLAFEFLKASLAESRARVAAVEWRLVLVIAVLTCFDVLTGLAFGFCLVAVLFIIEYSGMTGITCHATLKEVRSNVERSSDEAAVLDSFGDEAVIFWLTGYIFFGSAVGVVEEVEALIESSTSVRYVILDFEHVPAVDASGVHRLTEFASKCISGSPPIQVCFSGVVRRLRLAIGNAAESKHLVGLKLDPHVADALWWAEEGMLSMRKKRDSRISDGLHGSAREIVATSVPEVVKLFLRALAPQQLPAVVEHAVLRLAPATQLLNVAQGRYLFTEGAPATDIFYVVHGTVELERARKPDEGRKLPRHHLNKAKGDVFIFEEESSIRMQLVSAGAILGAAEYGSAAGSAQAFWYTSAKATADCRVLQVPFISLFATFEEQPAFGLAVAIRLGQLSSAHLLRLASRWRPGFAVAQQASRLELKVDSA